MDQYSLCGSGNQRKAGASPAGTFPPGGGEQERGGCQAGVRNRTMERTRPGYARLDPRPESS